MDSVFRGGAGGASLVGGRGGPFGMVGISFRGIDGRCNVSIESLDFSELIVMFGRKAVRR